jgi:hypothetical protein
MPPRQRPDSRFGSSTPTQCESFVCSWCGDRMGTSSVANGSVVAPIVPQAAKNYGICPTCLAPALSRLDAARSGSASARRVRRPSVMAVVPRN